MSEGAEVRRDLPELAAAINQEHHAFVAKFRRSVEHAIQAGELLAEAKAQCPHGSWLPWLEEHFEGSVRAAQGYMRVYHNRDEILAKAQDPAHLTVSGALAALAAPRTEVTVRYEEPRRDAPE